MNIRFAIPNGSLQNRTLEILRKAGYDLPLTIGRDDRIGWYNGVEFFLRDRENIASLVSAKTFDAGITGSDLCVNEGDKARRAVSMCSLFYGRNGNKSVRWVLAVPEGTTVKSWETKKRRRIGSERPRLAKHCLVSHWKKGDTLVALPGKEESAIADGLCDAVFVVTESGASLAAHKLVPVYERLFTSEPQLLYHYSFRKGSKEFDKIEEIGLAMQAILKAEWKVAVTFDIPRKKVMGLELPAVISPTINETTDPEWRAGQILISRHMLGETLRRLRDVGAKGVFVQDVQAYMEEGEH